LEVEEVLAELVEKLSGSILVRKAAPLDQHAPDTAALLRLQRPFWSRQNATIEDRRKGGRNSRRISAVPLQQPHVEGVVNAGALW